MNFDENLKNKNDILEIDDSTKDYLRNTLNIDVPNLYYFIYFTIFLNVLYI